MKHRRKLKIGLFAGSVGLVVLVGLLLPMLSLSGVTLPFCTLPKVSAQSDPCLDREVTISAQQVQLLQLQGTMNVQKLDMLALEGTDTFLRATLAAYENARPRPPIIITVPVLITSVVTAANTPTDLPPATSEPSPTPFIAATPLPANCVAYTLKEGDSIFGVAEQYGVDGNQLMAINHLDEQSAALLQIGDTLIIPLPGCSMASSTPTATLPPTATSAQVEIVRVLSPGDINAEAVDIRNNGAVIDLTGWKLSDAQGDSYTFPQMRLFTGSVITVYTRSGTNTPTAEFWGRSGALWSSGATVTLTDNHGKVQSVYSIP